MNEKLQYASMIEMPVNTCTVVHKPLKKQRKKKPSQNPEEIKQLLLDKINLSSDEQVKEESVDSLQTIDNEIVTTPSVEVYKKGSRKKDKLNKKITIIGVQLAIIGILIAGIFLTNAFYAGSGLNVFLNGIFNNSPTQKVDDRVYGEFAPVISITDGVDMVLADGVMTLSGEGSVYVWCDGKVSSIKKGEDGKFTLEITHSENFKSVLSGLDYAYADMLDQVYHNIPVGYIDGQIEMCFTRGDGSIIADYEIVDNSVVWAV